MNGRVVRQAADRLCSARSVPPAAITALVTLLDQVADDLDGSAGADGGRVERAEVIRIAHAVLGGAR